MWPILNEVHHELLPLHEEWVGGIKLQPTSIYGVRVNRNGSALAMHYDKVSVLACCWIVISFNKRAWRTQFSSLAGYFAPYARLAMSVTRHQLIPVCPLTVLGASAATDDKQIYTHVISSILHIAHEYFNDDEPWPIEIEDHNGELHAVNLEPGQVSRGSC